MKAYKASEASGKLVAKVESAYLGATDYSPLAKAEKVGNRVFELRTYTAEVGRLDDLSARFRDHTCKLFEKHGMSNVAYWNPLAYQTGASKPPDAKNTLIYLLAHKSQEAAKASFDAFRMDPDWVAARKASEERHQESGVTGTGFFITEDGYFVTNEHVAGEGANVRIDTSAGMIPAKVVKVDKLNDLALLKAEGKFIALSIGESGKVKLGATVATVGFPNPRLQGYSPKLARGEIGGLAGIQDDPRRFQISAPIQPGNSGGALVDERGNVVGVVHATLNQSAAIATSGTLAQSVNYAVKSSYLLSLLESAPEVASKLKKTNTGDRKFEDVVSEVEHATVLVRAQSTRAVNSGSLTIKDGVKSLFLVPTDYSAVK